MGAEGLTEATKSALLAANYVAARLNEYFPVLYTGDGGLVARDEKGRHVHRAFARRRRPSLVVERQRIALTTGAHDEWPTRHFDEIWPRGGRGA